jgi:hypothetical protein
MKFYIILIIAFLILLKTNFIYAQKNIFIISPLYGYHHNLEYHTEYPMGIPTTVSTSGSGYQTGVFMQAVFNKLFITNYPFYVRANHSNVYGNVLFTSYDFFQLSENILFNAGIGHVYHKIETPASDITINLPIPRIGLKINLNNIKLNPYISRTREDNTVEAGGMTIKNRYYYNLYGINIEYSLMHFWRHTLRYYYGVIPKNIGNDIYTLRYYTYLSFTKNIGIVLKYEYEKHKNKSVDKSITAGPFFMF